MSIRLKLFAFFTMLIALGISFLGVIVYDTQNASDMNKQQLHVKQINESMVRQFKQHTGRINLNNSRTWHSEHYIQMMIKPDGNIQQSTDRIWDTRHANNKLLAEINKSPQQGQHSSAKMLYVWAGTLLPKSKNWLVTLHQEHDNRVKEFISEYSSHILVSTIVMLWIAFWVSMVLGNVLTTLKKQKHTLEEQAASLEEARDNALKASKAKSTFLANMSHEIRTPLTAVIGYSDALLGSDQTREERLESINIIHRSSQHVLHVINEILDLSKIEAEKLEIEKLMTSPVQLLSEISALMQMQANDKGLEFKVNYSGRIPETIFTDPTRLKQILLNLFSNAVKFTDLGSVSIDVSCQAEKQIMFFAVTDTGIGMSEEQCEQVFEAFKQADTSTTRKYGGTGLGLSLSLKLAQMLGGNISVSSEEAAGSTFELEINTGQLQNIKLLSQDEINKNTEVQPETPSPLPIKTLSGDVLIVEDTEANQKLLEMYVSKLGAEVTLASNGKEAIEMTTEKEFDLILMDIQMPIMNGLEATSILREIGYKKPIIALTANVSNEDKNNYIAAGCDDHLCKPIERKRFIETLTAYLPHAAVLQDVSPVYSDLLNESPEIADLVEKFINELPNYINEAKEAFSQQNWGTLKNVIHQLKGLGGNYGYMQLSKYAEQIEFQLINKNEAEVDMLITQMTQYCDRIDAGKQHVIDIIRAG